MKFKIGFSAEEKKENPAREVKQKTKAEVKTKPSLVDIRFPDIYKSYTYYNDRFDLHEGDTVFVDGKLEGVAGRVVAVTCNFKIKLSDYKRVISVADTDVKGQLYFHKTRVVSFDPTTIPFGKIASWYFPPTDPEDIVSGEDDSTILLDKPETWKADIDPSEYEDIDDYLGVLKGYMGNADIVRIMDNKKVTDHHAIIPTMEITKTELSELPKGERWVLELIAARLLCATAQPYNYEATTVTLDCAGHIFTAKGKTVPEVEYEYKILNVKLTTTPLERVVASRMNAEQKEICELLMTTKGCRQYVGNVFGDTNWIPYVTSYYGYRVHPISGDKNYHTGVDIGMSQGTEIRTLSTPIRRGGMNSAAYRAAPNSTTRR